MKLEDLQKKIYSKDDDIDKREKSWDHFNPKEEEPEPETKGRNENEFDFNSLTQMDAQKQHGKIEREVNSRLSNRKKVIKFSLIGAGVLVAITLLILGLVKFQESAFSEEKVVVEISGPTEIASGQEIQYTVSLANKNRADLLDAVLKLNYSNEMVIADQQGLIKEGFNNAKIDVGKLSSGETKDFQFSIKTFGQRDKQVYFNAILAYKPDNFNSQFEKRAQYSGIIKSSLLGIDLMSVTREAASGEEVQLQVIVKNESKEDFSNIELKMSYPEGFSFMSSDPSVSKSNNKWSFNSIENGAQTKITITGSLEGPPDSIKEFTAEIGSARSNGDFLKYNEDKDVIKLVAPRIVISQTIDGIEAAYVNAGEPHEYEIKLKNNSGFPLRDLVLTEEISSPVLDKSKVLVSNGFYDSQKGTITWKASDVPSLRVLEANQETSVKFRISVLDKFPMESEADKNFVIASQAQVESLDVDSPLGQNKKIFSKKMETKVNSKLVLNSVGNYNDGEIPNQGPIPLTVGQETTFTLRFNILNTSNDLRDVILETSLPSGVSWKGKTIPQESGLDFNERTNELKWTMGTLPAGTGFISPVKTLAFQVGITPSVNQINQNVTLLNPIKVTATDAFTGQKVQYDFNEFLSTELSDVRSTDAVVKAE